MNGKIDAVLLYSELELIKSLLKKKKPIANSREWYLARKVDQLMQRIESRGAGTDL